MLKALNDAIVETPLPPCEVPTRCSYYELCERRKVACKAFAAYVYGRSKRSYLTKIPSKKIYDKIYHREEASDETG